MAGGQAGRAFQRSFNQSWNPTAAVQVYLQKQKIESAKRQIKIQEDTAKLQLEDALREDEERRVAQQMNAMRMQSLQQGEQQGVGKGLGIGRQQGIGIGNQQMLERIKQADPEFANAFMDDMQRKQEDALKRQAKAQDDLTDKTRVIAASLGLDPSNPQSWGQEGNAKVFQKLMSMKKAGATTVNMGLGTSAKTELEKQIITGEDALRGLMEMGDSYDPEFLTHEGQMKMTYYQQREKFKFPLDAKQADYVDRHGKFWTTARTGQLLYRKAITGVAGGKQEMTDIEKAIYDPKRDSPSMFKAKWKQQVLNTYKGINKDREMREKGLSAMDLPTWMEYNLTPAQQKAYDKKAKKIDSYKLPPAFFGAFEDEKKRTEVDKFFDGFNGGQ